MSKGKAIIGVTEKMDIFFEKVGALTKIQRLMICLVTFAVIGGSYYYFVFMPSQKKLTEVKNIYKTQVKKLSTYKIQAAQLPKYEKMMALAQEKFNTAMRALPDKRELPSLLAGISKAGSDAGLTFNLFKPGKEINKEYYKVLPIAVKVEGRYHQLIDFFYQITRLNRIVNINNVSVKKKGGSRKLEMACQAVTYMFVEKKPSKDKRKRKKKKR